MSFTTMYNSSTSLQNAILNILSNTGSTATPYNGENTILDDIYEDTVEPSEEPAPNQEPKIEPKQPSTQAFEPKRATPENEALIIPGVKINHNKVLTATEIIYRAMLNDQEFEDNSSGIVTGGKRADDMLTDNLLKGGNVIGQSDILEDIHESELPLPSERAQANIFSGGSTPVVAGGNTPVVAGSKSIDDFNAALQRYKSTQSVIEAISTSSESESYEDLQFQAVAHAGVSIHKNENSEEEDPSEVDVLEKVDKKELGIEEEDESDSEGSNSSSDDFIPSYNKSMKTTNAKYIRLIKEFKTPAKPSTILGGNVNRPKTVTVVNAFPYIVKSNPESK